MNTPSSVQQCIRGVNLNELIQKVIQWANDRNIIQGSTAIKQLDKTSEEFNELQRAVAALPYRQEHGIDLGYGPYEGRDEVADAFGDILVTLIIASHQLGFDLQECLAGAWEEIKDRKGRLVNGLFLKETE